MRITHEFVFQVRFSPNDQPLIKRWCLAVSGHKQRVSQVSRTQSEKCFQMSSIWTEDYNPTNKIDQALLPISAEENIQPPWFSQAQRLSLVHMQIPNLFFLLTRVNKNLKKINQKIQLLTRYPLLRVLSPYGVNVKFYLICLKFDL